MNILFYKTFAKQICGILPNRFVVFCQTDLWYFAKQICGILPVVFCQTDLWYFAKQICGILSNRFAVFVKQIYEKKSSPEGGMEVEKSGGISLLRHLPQVL